MSKKIFTKINNPELAIVNTTTGEIVKGVAKIHCSSIEDFMMCFLSSIPQITRLKGNNIRVLMWCWRFSSFNPSIPEANIITNDLAFKDNIRKAGGDLTDTVINKSIHTLYKEGMLLKRCKGSYFLNPTYFFRGTLSNRTKLLLNIGYNI